ncbi:glycosyltransferase family 4 protein [Patescibacteria group bacterium]
MKILVLKNPLESTPGGGGELHTMQVMRYLRERGHEIYFAGSCPELLSMARQENFETEEIDWAGSEAVSEMAIMKFFFKKKSIKKRYREYLIEQQKSRGIDLLYILSWNEKFLLGPIAEELGMRMVFVEHKLLGRFIAHNPWQKAYVEAAKQATSIAVSQSVKRSIVNQGVPESRVRVVYNGIDLKEFASVTKSAESKFQLGAISRLVPEKDLGRLIEAVKILRSKFPDISLEIVGQGPEKAKLEAGVRDAGLENEVKFIGGLDRHGISKFLSGLDIFVLLSTRGESFGLTLAEAGYMKLPCITTNIGGEAEVVSDRQTGLIIPANDTRALVDALGKLLGDENLRKQYGEAAHKRVQDNFTIDKMLAGIASIIETK